MNKRGSERSGGNGGVPQEKVTPGGSDNALAMLDDSDVIPNSQPELNKVSKSYQAPSFPQPILFREVSDEDIKNIRSNSDRNI